MSGPSGIRHFMFHTDSMRPVLWLLPVIILTSACRNDITETCRQFPYEQLREGDLAFRRGSSILSDAVVYAEKQQGYSHVGIIVMQDSCWRVIHAVPGELEYKGDFERVKSEPLETFFSESRARHGELAHTGLKDTMLIRELAGRCIRMAQDSVRFDNKYNLADTSAVYCTEFVFLQYMAVGIDLTEGRRTRVNAPLISGECILPEDIHEYGQLTSYYKY